MAEIESLAMAQQVTFEPNNAIDSMIVIKTASNAELKAVYSESHIDEPEFIQFSHCEMESYHHRTCSSLHSIQRDSNAPTNQNAENGGDAISVVSGITDLFDNSVNTSDKIVIPIIPPCDAQEYSECLDSGPLPIDSQSSRPITNGCITKMANLQYANLLNDCEQKADVIDELFNRATENLEFINENMTKLEQNVVRRQQQHGATMSDGEIRCPYRKLLNEFDRNVESYIHAACVHLEKKS